MREALARAYSYWIGAADLDGFRIDTLKHVERGFWQHFCPDVRRWAQEVGKKNFLQFGEAFDGHNDLLGAYTKNLGVDSVFYFSQKFQVFDGVFKSQEPTRNIESLWDQRIPKEGSPQHFGTVSHLCLPTNGGRTETGRNEEEDETLYDDEGLTDDRGLCLRQDMELSGPVDADTGKGLPPYKLLVSFLDNHDIPRFLFQDDGEPGYPCLDQKLQCSDEVCENHGDSVESWRHSGFCRRDQTQYRCGCDFSGLRAALGLLLTMDGIPCIYYGTEQNFNGGNDPTNREDLWSSGFDTSGETFRWIQSLTKARSCHAALRRGDMRVLWSSPNRGDSEASDAGIFAFERRYQPTSGGMEIVLVIVNTSASRKSVTSSDGQLSNAMITSFEEGEVLHDALNPTTSVRVGTGGRALVELPARSVTILYPRGQKTTCRN